MRPFWPLIKKSLWPSPFFRIFTFFQWCFWPWTWKFAFFYSPKFLQMKVELFYNRVHRPLWLLIKNLWLSPSSENLHSSNCSFDLDLESLHFLLPPNFFRWKLTFLQQVKGLLWAMMIKSYTFPLKIYILPIAHLTLTLEVCIFFVPPNASDRSVPDVSRCCLILV